MCLAFALTVSQPIFCLSLHAKLTGVNGSMTKTSIRCRLIFTAILGIVLCRAGETNAQLIRAELDRGFARSSSIAMTVDEMLGSQKARKSGEPILGPGYPALWIAEVQFKPVRFVRMDVTDPGTGVTKPELVWYMIYRVIPRDYTELAGNERGALLEKLEDPTIQPQNYIDAAPSNPLLIPRFVLRTDDAGPPLEYTDEVNLQVQQAIFEREFRQRASGLRLLNSVQAVMDVREPVSVDDPEPLTKASYGVAIWRGVDPNIDYFTVFMNGFSNAYKISMNDTGEEVVEHKVVEQKFGRPGDSFEQSEMEFRVLGDPTWKYLPRAAKLTVPNRDSILRNVSSQLADEE